jgi:lysozyme
MKTNKAGFDLIKEFEGYHRELPNGDAEAYIDPVGVWTVGWGSIMLNGRPVRRGDVISRKLAQELLEAEVAGFEKDIERLVKVELNENQHAALVSLCYNIGAGAFAGSTARRLLNAGDYRGCAEAFLMWNKGTINGQLTELAGLTRRRKAERELFLRAVSIPAPQTPIDAPVSTQGRHYAPCPVPLPWTRNLGNIMTSSVMPFGDDIYHLQCALIGLGYLRKPADGELVGDVFNEHVEYAVRVFQGNTFGKEHMDGIVGPKTRAAIEAALTKARAPKPPVDNSVATLRATGGEYVGAWAGLKNLILYVGDDTFAVASGARGRQTLRRPQDPRSFPGNLEPIPQGRYRIGSIEFANGKDNYEGSFGAGLGPVWVGLDAEFSDDRGAFGIHQDHNIGASPGSAGCVVFRDISDLKRFVAALRKHNPRVLDVNWNL